MKEAEGKARFQPSGCLFGYLWDGRDMVGSESIKCGVTQLQILGGEAAGSFMDGLKVTLVSGRARLLLSYCTLQPCRPTTPNVIEKEGLELQAEVCCDELGWLFNFESIWIFF